MSKLSIESKACPSCGAQMNAEITVTVWNVDEKRKIDPYATVKQTLRCPRCERNGCRYRELFRASTDNPALIQPGLKKLLEAVTIFSNVSGWTEVRKTSGTQPRGGR